MLWREVKFGWFGVEKEEIFKVFKICFLIYGFDGFIRDGFRKDFLDLGK